MRSELQISTLLVPPPGPALRRPTPSNPAPSCNPHVFNDAMDVRTMIFVNEQGCSPESEFDEDDPRSWHWVFYDGRADKQIPIGVIRLVPPPHPSHETLLRDSGASHQLERHAEPEEPYVKLTRVGLLPAYRGMGLSRKLVDTALDWAAEHKHEVVSAGCNKQPWNGLVLVHAQVQVEALYARMGFVTDESMGTWEEERILHVGMWKRVNVPP
ncbi:predicted protein [Uncinocarpus reesii 1704]|uniref:N-acetyltransferase domain-containing protein n=1 Tax=Uncinocarpus reesii (strain UAMH 1704) TaxID=336963 RepID=C4JN51_UNCRE|nr:uncharacterized protein UREG_04259 [Uncinocarpus reesii 1704]EEP79413.1 predicted protein [Uncinocarpus reesii 1704]